MINNNLKAKLQLGIVIELAGLEFIKNSNPGS